MNKKIFFILLFAFLIRLIALDQSFWLDEATTAKVVEDYSYWNIITKFSPKDFHPPLYYLFMKFWTNFFGYSEVALRFPSVIFSLLTGWVIYKIGRLRKSFGEPLWAAAFFLFNPLIVYYSQEARMYMMVTFLLTASLYFYLRLISNINNQKSKIHIKNQIFFNLFIFLSLLTFYGSIFLIIPMLIYLLYKKQYKFFSVSCFMFFVSFLILSPFLLKQFNNAQKSFQIVLNWKLVLGTASIKNLLLIPLKFSFGRISFYPKWLYWLIAGGWTVFVLYQISKIKNIYLFYYLLIFPLILGLIISFFTPLLQYFRFLYLLPIVSILLAFSLKPSLFDRAKMVTFLGFLILSLLYLFNPAFHREDWKSLAKSLPKDKPIYMVTPSSDALRYYRPDTRIVDLRFDRNHFPNLNDLIIIPYTADIYGFDYKNILKNKDFYLKKVDGFRNLTVEYWSSTVSSSSYIRR